MLVDTTSAAIQAPRDQQDQYFYYEYHKKKHTLKYETGFSLATGRLCWCSGGYPGSRADKTILRSSGLLSKLVPNEVIVADSQYFGVEHCITIFVGEPNALEYQWNLAIKTIRQSIERFHRRMKVFGILRTPWRGDIANHRLVFLTISHIASLDTIIRPLDAVH
jgi:hypothetical protein